jgi:hypothetical protein
VAVDPWGDAYVAGLTESTESTFPVAVGPYLNHKGGMDAFVAKVRLTLSCDTFQISEKTGGIANFTLHTDIFHSNRPYLLLGTMSGTSPGIPLKGGEVLPLNWDLFTDLIISLINTPVFSNFMSNLDGMGNANAQFNTLGPIPPGYVGTVMHYAYLLNNPKDFASNPWAIEIVP